MFTSGKIYDGRPATSVTAPSGNKLHTSSMTSNEGVMGLPYISGGQETLEALVAVIIKDKLLKQEQRFEKALRDMEKGNATDKTNLFKRIEVLDYENRQLSSRNQSVSAQLAALYAMIKEKFVNGSFIGMSTVLNQNQQFTSSMSSMDSESGSPGGAKIIDSQGGNGSSPGRHHHDVGAGGQMFGGNIVGRSTDRLSSLEAAMNHLQSMLMSHPTNGVDDFKDYVEEGNQINMSINNDFTIMSRMRRVELVARNLVDDVISMNASLNGKSLDGGGSLSSTENEIGFKLKKRNLMMSSSINRSPTSSPPRTRNSGEKGKPIKKKGDKGIYNDPSDILEGSITKGGKVSREVKDLKKEVVKLNEKIYELEDVISRSNADAYKKSVQFEELKQDLSLRLNELEKYSIEDRGEDDDVDDGGKKSPSKKPMYNKDPKVQRLDALFGQLNSVVKINHDLVEITQSLTEVHSKCFMLDRSVNEINSILTKAKVANLRDDFKSINTELGAINKEALGLKTTIQAVDIKCDKNTKTIAEVNAFAKRPEMIDLPTKFESFRGEINGRVDKEFSKISTLQNQNNSNFQKLSLLEDRVNTEFMKEIEASVVAVGPKHAKSALPAPSFQEIEVLKKNLQTHIDALSTSLSDIKSDNSSIDKRMQNFELLLNELINKDINGDINTSRSIDNSAAPSTPDNSTKTAVSALPALQAGLPPAHDLTPKARAANLFRKFSASSGGDNAADVSAVAPNLNPNPPSVAPNPTPSPLNKVTSAANDSALAKEKQDREEAEKKSLARLQAANAKLKKEQDEADKQEFERLKAELQRKKEEKEMEERKAAEKEAVQRRKLEEKRKEEERLQAIRDAEEAIKQAERQKRLEEIKVELVKLHTRIEDDKFSIKNWSVQWKKDNGDKPPNPIEKERVKHMYFRLQMDMQQSTDLTNQAGALGMDQNSIHTFLRANISNYSGSPIPSSSRQLKRGGSSPSASGSASDGKIHLKDAASAVKAVNSMNELKTEEEKEQEVLKAMKKKKGQRSQGSPSPMEKNESAQAKRGSKANQSPDAKLASTSPTPDASSVKAKSVTINEGSSSSTKGAASESNSASATSTTSEPSPNALQKLRSSMKGASTSPTPVARLPLSVSNTAPTFTTTATEGRPLSRENSPMVRPPTADEVVKKLQVDLDNLNIMAQQYQKDFNQCKDNVRIWMESFKKENGRDPGPEEKAAKKDLYFESKKALMNADKCAKERQLLKAKIDELTAAAAAGTTSA